MLLLRSALAITSGITTIFVADDFKEEESIIEPLLITIDHICRDIICKLLFVPVDFAMVATIINKHQVAYLGTPNYRLCAG